MTESTDSLELTQPVYLEAPLFCRTCSARFRQDCMCVAPVRLEIPLAELDQ
jgi:hypothetical protein